MSDKFFSGGYYGPVLHQLLCTCILDDEIADQSNKDGDLNDTAAETFTTLTIYISVCGEWLLEYIKEV